LVCRHTTLVGSSNCIFRGFKYRVISVRFLLIILIFGISLAMPATAQDFDPEQLLQVAQNDGMTLSQAVESVRRQTGGRIISAETKRSGNREVHHIKVLTDDGKVKTHKVQGRKRDNG
jgi:hypothetical protein